MADQIDRELMDRYSQNEALAQAGDSTFQYIRGDPNQRGRAWAILNGLDIISDKQLKLIAQMLAARIADMPEVNAIADDKLEMELLDIFAVVNREVLDPIIRSDPSFTNTSKDQLVELEFYYEEIKGIIFREVVAELLRLRREREPG